MTQLDREWFSLQRCEQCDSRRAQLVIDERPHDRRGGKYHRFCWQCYWFYDKFRLGPIINCGPLWDGVDAHREAIASESAPALVED
jgi:hypothetical protein